MTSYKKKAFVIGTYSRDEAYEAQLRINVSFEIRKRIISDLKKKKS